MLSGAKIEEALALLEQGAQMGPLRRRATDTPQRRVIDAVIEGVEGELLVRVLPDGTRVIALVPVDARMPTTAELDELLREVRG